MKCVALTILFTCFLVGCGQKNEHEEHVQTKETSKPWNELETQLQAQIVVAAVKKGEKDLALGVETGDADGIRSRIGTPFTRILRGWNEQVAEIKNPISEKYSACYDAAFHFQFYADSFVRNDSISNRENRAADLRDYRKAYSACKALISSG